MALVASQLTANISITGGDQAKTVLLNMSDNSKKAQDQLTQLQNAAKGASDILANRFSAEVKNAQSGLQDLSRRAESAGLDVSNFTSLQLKASEAAARLGVAQAQAAAAMEKANTVTADASSSAEKIALAQSKATLAAENVKKAELAAGDAMSLVQGEATRLADALEMSGAKSNLFAGAMGGLKERVGGFFGGIQEAAGGLLEFGSKLGMTIMGVQMMSGMFMQVTTAAGAMIGNFQQTLTKLTTTAGESAGNLKMVGDGMLAMAGPTATSVKDLGDAMYWVESGGARGKKALDDLRIAAMGAKAENADLTGVTKALMFTLNNYGDTGLTAAGAMNTLITAVGEGSLTLQGLTSGISNVMPTAHAFGISLTDVAAGLATMSSQGDDASAAATHLAMMIKTIEAPATAGSKALASIGLTTQQVSDEMRKSLPGALELIVDHLKNKFPEGSTAYNEALKAISGGSRSMQAILETTGTHLDVFKQNVDKITGSVKSGGDSIAGWDAVQQNFNFRMDQAKDAVNALAVKMATALAPAATQLIGFFVDTAMPALSRFSDWFIKDGIPGLQHFVEPLQTAGTWLNTFVGHGQAAIPILTGIGAVIAGLLVPAMGALAVETITATWPVLAVAAAVAGLTAMFLHFYNTSAPFKAFVDGIIPSLTQFASVAATQVWPVLQGIGAFLAATFLPVWEQLVETWQTQLLPSLTELMPLFNELKPALTAIAEVIGGILIVDLGLLVATLAGSAKAFAMFLQGAIIVAGGVAGMISGLVQIVSGGLALIYDLFSFNWKKISADLGTIFSGMLRLGNGFSQVFEGLFVATFGAIGGYVWGFVQGIIGYFQHLYDVLVGHSIIPDMFNAVFAWFAKLPNQALSLVAQFKDGVIAKFNEISINVTNTIHDMINGVVDHLNDGISAVENFVNFFGTGLNDVAKALGTQNIVPEIHLGRIPHYAQGTDSHPGGPAVLGERGRELVWLPKGAQVAPNHITEAILSMTGGKVPGYADGIGDIGSKILGWLSGGAQSILDNLIASTHITAPTILGMPNIATGIFDKLKTWALSWIGNLIPKFDFSFGGSSNISGDLKSIIAQAIAITGVPGSWAGPLATIAMKESGGNASAVNNWDSNALAGHPSQGLFQMIPSTFLAHALPGHLDILSGLDSALSAIGYIQGRYGDVFHVPGIMALAAGQSYIGYSGGGVLSEPVLGRGLHTGTNYSFAEKGPEMIVPYVPSGVNLAQSHTPQPAPATQQVQQTVVLQIDGHRFANAVLPHLTSAIRYSVNVQGM